MDFDSMLNYVKRTFPIMMLDTLLDVRPRQWIKASKKVTDNETRFLGHFPGFPILPGMLIVEAIGQCASILLRESRQGGFGDHEFVVLASIEDIKFLIPILPGHTVIFDVRALKMTEDAVYTEAILTVDNAVVTNGRLGFAVVDARRVSASHHL